MSRSKQVRCRLGRNCGVCCYVGRNGARLNREHFQAMVLKADIDDGLDEYAEPPEPDAFNEFIWRNREPHDNCFICGTVE